MGLKSSKIGDSTPPRPSSRGSSSTSSAGNGTGNKNSPRYDDASGLESASPLHSCAETSLSDPSTTNAHSSARMTFPPGYDPQPAEEENEEEQQPSAPIVIRVLQLPAHPSLLVPPPTEDRRSSNPLSPPTSPSVPLAAVSQRHQTIYNNVTRSLQSSLDDFTSSLQQQPQQQQRPSQPRYPSPRPRVAPLLAVESGSAGSFVLPEMVPLSLTPRRRDSAAVAFLPVAVRLCDGNEFHRSQQQLLQQQCESLTASAKHDSDTFNEPQEHQAAGYNVNVSLSLSLIADAEDDAQDNSSQRGGSRSSTNSAHPPAAGASVSSASASSQTTLSLSANTQYCTLEGLTRSGTPHRKQIARRPWFVFRRDTSATNNSVSASTPMDVGLELLFPEASATDEEEGALPNPRPPSVTDFRT